MTCCVIALALAMQIIESWRRLKAWLGIVPKATNATHGLGTVVAGLLERLQHPAVRYAVFALIMVEAFLGATWVYAHRVHLGNELAAVVFETTGLGSALCDADVTTASDGW